MKRSETKTKGNRWCRLEIELRGEPGDEELSICGSEGVIVTPAQARRDSLDYWISFFDDNPGEMREMNQRFGRRFTSSRGAAKFVLDTDGEYHGLDVDSEGDKGVFIVESGGQIRETLTAWFPEAAPYFKWHLNKMHAECVHQEARGETWKTHPKAECTECGWKLVCGWSKRTLPPEVIAWAKGVAK